MKKVLVTGCEGQLGKCLQSISNQYSDVVFTFVDKNQLDITNPVLVDYFFSTGNYHYCINTAAYTSVDKAEEEIGQAYLINYEGARHLAQACKRYNCVLIHISTDYVFDGFKGSPYLESDVPNPINVYGESKLAGENIIRKLLERYYIIRTSWLYSEYGNNFMRTMLRLGREHNEVRVVADQLGSPTYARDLALYILYIIQKAHSEYGTYHYCNNGMASWAEFAREIFALSDIKVRVIPITTYESKAVASRPPNSLLDITKIGGTFAHCPRIWKEALKIALVNNERVTACLRP